MTQVQHRGAPCTLRRFFRLLLCRPCRALISFAVWLPFLARTPAERCTVLEQKQDKMALFLDKTNKKVRWLEDTLIPEVRACLATAETSTPLPPLLSLS